MTKAKKEVAREFPTGTQVQLCVGGPAMAVAGVTGSGRVVCQWFDGNALREAKFVPETLSSVESGSVEGSEVRQKPDKRVAAKTNGESRL